MRKGPVFIQILCCLLPACAISQGWQRTFGNPDGLDFFYDVVKTANGGTISTGSTTELNNLATDVFLVRTDAGGQAFFTKNFGATGKRESGQAVFELADGSILVAGSLENATDTSSFLLKTDAYGNQIWWKNLGVPNSKIWDGCQTPDGHFVFCGEKKEGNTRLFFLIKSNSDGLVIWTKTWGGSPLNILRAVRAKPNGYLVATGYTVNDEGDYDAYLTEIEHNGDLLWENSYGTSLNEYAFGLSETDDGTGWLVAGYESDGADENGWVLFTDENGLEISQVIFDKNGLEQFRSIAKDADGGFVFLGQSRDNLNDDRDLFLVKTDQNATEIFSKKYGSAAGDAGYAILSDPVGHFLAGHIGQQAGLIKTDAAGGIFSNIIKGRATRDLDEDCIPDPSPIGLAGWTVKLETASGDLYSTTDTAGFYEFQVDTGSFLIKIVEKSVYWASCTGSVAVNFMTVGDTVAQDFLVKTAVHCPLLQVDICTNKLKRCFDNVYFVRLCNIGTEVAGAAKVLVLLDPFLTPGASSIPYSASGDSLLFEVGDMQPLDCQSFTFHVVVDCDSTLLGQTHCTTAFALPDSMCLPAPGWDGSNLEVGGRCDGDSLKLTIKNTGAGAMAMPMDYVIIEDVVLFESNPAQLLPGADVEFAIGDLSGRTFTLQIDQTPGHPGGNLHPSISVEGCGAWPFATGFVLQFPTDDGDPSTDIDCRENVGSFDPNDKKGFPVGTTAAHFIEPGQEIEYILRFQNTGTDTAVRVEVRDTLSSWLNPGSIQPGATSHEDYTIAFDGPGVVRFIFEGIDLPDSTTDLAGSNGFVKFRIAQKTGIPLGSVVENRGAIFFDFNPPVMTNTVFHTIGQDIINGTGGFFAEKKEKSPLLISPNPAGDFAWLEWPELAGGPFLLRLLDENGQVLFSKKTVGNKQLFNRGSLGAGIYFLEISYGKQVLAISRLVLK